MLTKEEASFRTLIGTNMFFDGVGAIAELFIESKNNSNFISTYEENINLFTSQLNFSIEKLYKRVYTKGVIYAIATTFDLKYVAREILETAFNKTLAHFYHEDFDLDASIKDLELLNKKEFNLFLRSIYSEASHRLVEMSFDENILSLGSGSGLYQVNLLENPEPQIPWECIYNIPSVAVTGSNGKTTTVILTKFISEQSGKTVAYSSTERIMVGNEIIEKGDLSGPYGARAILNNKNVDVAVLEFARGGITRRGLGTNYVDAAVVINVSNDHIGLNGIDDIHDLAQAKFLIHHAVKPNGYNIVNLDDPLSLGFIEKLPNNKIFLSRKLDFSAIQKFMKTNDLACFIVNDILTVFMGQEQTPIMDIKDILLTFRGLATHNIENVLAATALSIALKCSLEDIKNGLLHFNATELNKGRFNIFHMKQYENTIMIVDYAHNVAAVENIIKFAKNAIGPNGQVTLLIGLTGDRIFMIDEMSQLIVDSKVDYLMLKTFNSRLRGASVGEVANLMENSLIKLGFNKAKFLPTVNTELEALEKIFSNLENDHAYVVLSQDDIEEVVQKIQEFNS